METCEGLSGNGTCKGLADMDICERFSGMETCERLSIIAMRTRVRVLRDLIFFLVISIGSDVQQEQFCHFNFDLNTIK